MKYHCTGCETDFEHHAGKLRCPQCLRQHGLVEQGDQLHQQAAEPAQPERGRRRLLLVLLVLSLAGLTAGGGLLYHRSQTDLPAPGQLAVLDGAMLIKTLKQRGVPADQAVNPFAAGAAAQALAGAVSETDPHKRAVALARQVATRIKGLTVDLEGHGQGPVLLPGQLLAAIKAGKRPRVLSYELALLLATVLRAGGLEGVLAQEFAVDAPMPTADPGGAVGRYLVVVHARGQLGRKPLVVLDPVRALALPAWAGKGRDPGMQAHASASMEQLDDASAAARLLSLRALRARRDDPQKAYRLSALALSASSPSANLHVVRALVLRAAGGAADAVTEARKALSLRQDAPRHTALAMLLAAHDKPHKAALQLRQALKLDPRFWPAHQVLAMMLADPKQSQKHMDAALAVAPAEPAVQMTLAARQLRAGKAEQAITTLRRVLAVRPGQEARLMLYQALLGTGKTQQAEGVKKQLLAAAREPGKMARLLKLLSARTGGGSAKQPAAPAAPEAPPNTPKMPRIKLPDVKLSR